MDRSTRNLLLVAKRIENSHPVLARELGTNVCQVAAVNPDAWDMKTEVEQALKSLEELKKSLTQAVAEHDAAESAKVLEEGMKNVDSFLKDVDARMNVGSIAGVGDWVKSLFKGKKPEDEDEVSDAQYDVDVDSIVEGDLDWGDPSHYVGEETTQQNAFFRGVKRVVSDFRDLTESAARKGQALSKSTVDDILKEVTGLLQTGEEILGRFTKSEPEKKKPEMPAPKSEKTPSEGLLPQGWKATFNNYADLIADEKDEGKIVKYLKEMFRDVGPLLEDERVTISARITSHLAGFKVKFAGQEGRPDFLLELDPHQKFTSHPNDKIFLTYYNGWSWTHTNVDGQGTHDTTNRNLTPTAIVQMIDEFIIPDEAAQEAIGYFNGIIEAGKAENGVFIQDTGPSSLPSSDEVMREMQEGKTVADPADPFGVKRTYSLLIRTAHAHPEMRGLILPMVASDLKKRGVKI